MILESGREKEIERNINLIEKHQLVASRICPDRGSNLYPGNINYFYVSILEQRGKEYKHTVQNLTFGVPKQHFLHNISTNYSSLLMLKKGQKPPSDALVSSTSHALV